MFCKHCGQEIDDSAKTCAHCGSSTDTKTVKTRKPIYKRVWFWIIVTIVAVTLFGGDGEGEDVSETEPLVSTVNATVETSAATSAASEPKEIEEDSDNDITVGEKNALRSALSYLNFTAFSYEGLIDQLEYEGYTIEEATYAVDNCGADWNEQALLSAKNYLDFTAFSYTGLIDQLEYEGFTTEEATYGVDNCGADWFEQAAKCAESYLDYTSFSRSGLIDQLEYEGFTYEQAVYGVEQNGL